MPGCGRRAFAKATSSTSPGPTRWLSGSSRRSGHSPHSRCLTPTPYVGTVAGHSDDLNAVAFSPDAATLATASLDGRAILLTVL
ncbi:MAG: hypothetical protein ACRDRP_11915 [Pseudonocardiaceae bacterium]